MDTSFHNIGEEPPQNEALLQPDQNATECQICLQEKLELYGLTANRCQHRFCLSCSTQHITAAIQQFRDLRCPHLGCTAAVDPSSAPFQTLTPALTQLYKKQKRLQQVLSNSNLRRCQQEECSGVVRIEIVPCVCDECQRKHCPRCHQFAHDGDCPSESGQDENHRRMMTSMNFRKCSNCHIYVEKLAGCNYVNCRCGNYFCFVCGQPWETDPCRFQPIKRFNLKVRLILATMIEIKKDPLQGIYPAVACWIIKLSFLMVYILLAGLIVPIILCAIACLLSLMLSPIWLLFMMQTTLRSPKLMILTTSLIICCYPILSCVLTLMLVAFCCSYFLFRNGLKQDIYQPVEIAVLRYAVRFLTGMHWLTHY